MSGAADPPTQPIPRIDPAAAQTQVIPAAKTTVMPTTAAAETQIIPVVPADPETRITGSGDVESGIQERSLARDSLSMVIPTLVSRITGFVSKLLLAAVIGTGVVNDSYQVAFTLPSAVYELLLGGVLTSVVVPLLVRAQKEDADGGEAYAQRMVTMATVLLGIATVLMVISAPLLIRLYMSRGADSQANPELATALAYLLMPEILFFGLGALFTAILNARHVFGPPAWAPVLNNVVVIVGLGLYSMAPGEISLDPVQMGNTKLLILGIGTTMGIVVQAAWVVPALLRSGFRFRWRWGLDPRFREFGGLAAWVIAYAAISAVSMFVIIRVATGHAAGGVTAFNYAWLLWQLPYGVLGFSLLSAIMPRMSASAADHDVPGVVAHMSQGARLSTVMLTPLSGVLTIAGISTGIVLFSYGKSSPENAYRLGYALALSAFGLVPFSLNMLQLRVFYAMKDSRTPTLINAIRVGVMVPMSLLVPVLWHDTNEVVVGLSAVYSFSFVVGAVVGQIWLRARLGHADTKRLLTTTGKAVGATIGGCLAAWLVTSLVLALLGVSGASEDRLLTAWISLPLEVLVTLAVSFGLLVVLRTEELGPAARRIAGLVRRR
ncbi:lipid II flippase MurJ [Longimycelium tulufanense]|uniref:Lipid II flippase MurJ n=1 Tax=Longimycelium tulufanense TaxID=907463 RepID=A0A8J3CF87_9PSEU|nr:murein biosynthesis integral membrane protein MurJ [Longimycelium tulufanense]GGM66773.1 lipid II flippase MurJ [Longimycelium tulufanense]